MEGENGDKWKLLLWSFVSKFTEYDAKKLYKFYRKTKKKNQEKSEEEKKTEKAAKKSEKKAEKKRKPDDNNAPPAKRKHRFVDCLIIKLLK